MGWNGLPITMGWFDRTLSTGGAVDRSALGGLSSNQPFVMGRPSQPITTS